MTRTYHLPEPVPATEQTITVGPIRYTSTGDLIGARCACGATFAAVEVRVGLETVGELRAWIGEHGACGEVAA